MARAAQRFLPLLALTTGLHASVAGSQTAASTDPASLAGLNDIIAPPALSLWWPLAPGGYMLLGLVLLTAGACLWRVFHRYKENRYRTAALRELHALAPESSTPGQTAAAILELLKRTALAAYPRADVAALAGADWWAFLDGHCEGSEFSAGLGQTAEAMVYRGALDDVDNTGRLLRAAEHWVRRHRVHPENSVALAQAPRQPAGGT